jgi:cathepsin L
MNKLLFALFIALTCVSAVCVKSSFASWKSLHGKQYGSEQEHNYRLGVYKFNLEYVEEHNRKNLGFTLGMNKFGDLTAEEFKILYNGMRINASQIVQSGNVHTHDDRFELPDSVDWRTKGVVTGVKDQGQCGSCWAFSTTGSVEGMTAIKTGKLVSVSEQNLVDCSGSYGNYGCNGGLMDSAFKYIIANKGIDTEDSYPYTARDGSCKFNRANVGATISSYTDVQAKSESALQNAIANIGPISVAIDAGHSSFQLYKSGVYFESKCSPTQLDHGVLAVGYGTDTGKDYYIVKNSWGTDWGMSGYILMSRNKNNNCGISTMSSYPKV